MSTYLDLDKKDRAEVTGILLRVFLSEEPVIEINKIIEEIDTLESKRRSYEPEDFYWHVNYIFAYVYQVICDWLIYIIFEEIKHDTIKNFFIEVSKIKEQDHEFKIRMNSGTLLLIEKYLNAPTNEQFIEVKEKIQNIFDVVRSTFEKYEVLYDITNPESMSEFNEDFVESICDLKTDNEKIGQVKSSFNYIDVEYKEFTQFPPIYFSKREYLLDYIQKENLGRFFDKNIQEELKNRQNVLEETQKEQNLAIPQISITTTMSDFQRIFDFLMKAGIVSSKTEVKQILKVFFSEAKDPSELYYGNRNANLENKQKTASSKYYNFVKFCASNLKPKLKEELADYLMKNLNSDNSD